MPRNEDDAADDETWAADLRATRAEKDEFLADHPQSPLPPDERESFDGLPCFDPDPAYRVRATASLPDDPEPVDLTVRNGEAMRYVPAVSFSFVLPGDDGESTLTAYRQGDDEEALFVPFRDKTTGQETYDGGRYMDLHPEGTLGDGDEVTLDFNLAYTPFCAFSDAFACPLPPEENWLDAAVRAGERAP
ncbi:DUF1684 domain-containing protein [Candidatus Halobonum tyrrellensis]|uniref:DUF1684 domain-containing protein n=1 Tax=Candidatus Halobonum tyrrellensis G22 TaxID=1324957 RepID=V4HKK5_9EURY|nr:DUF1684 domain-containing protein [Candidatus Halobonum tyrrellensis]ESP88454.1 hypothetical protein K933_08342 [Candidatus Halobonum tyrrellensis G22]